MATFDMYAGLSGMVLAGDSFDLGEGVTIRRTYAHLMAPFMMAFGRPKSPEQHHPGPLVAARGGFAFDMEAEIHIPASLESTHGSLMGLAQTIGAVFRLGVNPALVIPALANYSFSSMPERPREEAWIWPLEFSSKQFPLSSGVTEISATHVEWVANRWPLAVRLRKESAEFDLALNALDRGQFLQSQALMLVSLWGALEAMFSPSTSELRFRVAALISSYLEPPGESRLALQRDVSKLYDRRSAAAHGKPKHAVEDVLETFNLLARVLRKILDEQKVPSRDTLEKLLFGVRQEDL